MMGNEGEAGVRNVFSKKRERLNSEHPRNAASSIKKGKKRRIYPDGSFSLMN